MTNATIDISGTPSTAPDELYDVLIVGTGFAGICMAMEMRRRGIGSFVILEKADGVGGVWRDNAYPGCAADIPAMLYSYSTEPQHPWKGVYASQPEIERYINDCVDRHALRGRIRFGKEVVGARLDEGSGIWTVSTADGSTYRTRFFVTAVGQLSRPREPDIAGLDRFAGTLFHSARWKQDFVADGRTIGVLGNGSSAIQFVPEIARTAARVTVFQRSPSWVVPKADRDYAWYERLAFRYLPFVARKWRQQVYDMFETNFPRYRHGTDLNEQVRERTFAEMRRWIGDPDLIEKLTPNHAPGCKRIVVSNDWYRTLASDNVRVVTEAVTELTETGAVAADGSRHEFDTVILGTGFHAVDMLAPMRIMGRDGTVLHDRWSDGAEAYRGVSVDGFPNLFIMYGPNSNTHNSLLVIFEAQSTYVGDHIQRGLRDRCLYEVRSSVFRRYNVEVQAKAKDYVWSGDCGNWYNNSDGKAILNWPGRTQEYIDMMRLPDVENYQAVRVT